MYIESQIEAINLAKKIQNITIYLLQTTIYCANIYVQLKNKKHYYFRIINKRRYYYDSNSKWKYD